MGTEFKDEIEGLIDKRSQAYTDITRRHLGICGAQIPGAGVLQDPAGVFKLQRLFRPGRSGWRGNCVHSRIRQREAGDRILRRI